MPIAETQQKKKKKKNQKQARETNEVPKLRL